MNAAEIARALGGKREGRSWRCPCPLHGGRSLIVTPGRAGNTLFNCKAGCAQDDVLAKLIDLGLFGSGLINRDRRRETERKRREEVEFRTETERLRRRIDSARALYARAMPAAGTPAETYLRSRGITLPMPECLRFLAHCPHRNGRYFPVMVAPIVGVSGHLIAVHKTFLRSDGQKADLPKEEQRECIGPVAGGAVRLVEPREGEQLIVAEGLETALSCMQLFNLPAWAALSAPGLAALELPQAIRSVVICADNDRNAAGLEAALAATNRWKPEGRAVSTRWPRKVGQDFNDVLRERCK